MDETGGTKSQPLNIWHPESEDILAPAEREIAELRADNTRLRAALGAVEKVWDPELKAYYCLWCSAYEIDEAFHEDDCQRQLALGGEHES